MSYLLFQSIKFRQEHIKEIKDEAQEYLVVNFEQLDLENKMYKDY